MVVRQSLLAKLKLLYKEVVYASDRLCFCRVDDNWYLYNIQENLLDKAHAFNKVVLLTESQLVIAESDKQTIIYDSSGNIVNTVYNPVKVCRIVKGLVHIEIVNKNLNGIIDLKTNGIVAPFNYSGIRFYHDCDYIVLQNYNSEILIDYTGKHLTTKLYDAIFPLKTNDAIAKLNDDLYIIKIKNTIEEKYIGDWDSCRIFSDLRCKIINTI